MSQKTLKASAIVADLTTYLDECAKFEKANTVIEKHVSTQIVQVPKPVRSMPGLQLPGAGGVVTTIMVSVLYVHELPKMEVVKN